MSVFPSVCPSARPSAFSFPGDNLSKYQWIFAKLGRCIGIVKVWFGIASWQISLILDGAICPHTTVAGYYLFIHGLQMWSVKKIHKSSYRLQAPLFFRSYKFGGQRLVFVSFLKKRSGWSRTCLQKWRASRHLFIGEKKGARVNECGLHRPLSTTESWAIIHINGTELPHMIALQPFLQGRQSLWLLEHNYSPLSMNWLKFQRPDYR